MAADQVTSSREVDKLSTKDIVIRLAEIGSFRFGGIVLEQGLTTPIYLDLRLTISHPRLILSMAEAMYQKVVDAGLEYDLLCGVPYTALPFASLMSALHDIPMVMRRKEPKKHGTGKILEGVYQPGQRVLIVEDVIASGAAIIETAITLRREGLQVTDVVLFLECQPFGIKTLADLGIKVHSLTSHPKALSYLVEDGRFLAEEKRQEVLDWLARNPVPLDPKLVEELKSVS